jgi:exopolysaccharide production protein ExoQ
MSKASIRSFELDRARPPTPKFDKCVIVPISACIYALIVAPLLIFVTTGPQHTLEGLMETRPENRIFWPAVAAISLILAVLKRSRLSKLTWPPHIICLLAYLAFAGASVAWAFRPELSFIRFAQEVMVVTSIVLPAMLAARTTDIMRGLFLCFAFASILNFFFVLGGHQVIVTYGAMEVEIGYPGYFTGKNYLGECAAIAFILSLHEMLNPGLRRALGIVVAIIATLLIFWSDSKTALGLALIAPFLAELTLLTIKLTRISPAIVLLSIPFCYAVLSRISGFNMNRVSYMLYGDSTFTGRTIIWDFAQAEIDRRPLLGWGYQSFWLVGPDAPSIVDAPGWVKSMPNAHNGYYDTMLELGYIGYALLVIFIIATLHAVGRVADRDPARARLVLSLALYIILFNYLESLWMRGFEFLWVVFVILAAEIGRYLQPFPPDGRSQAMGTARSTAPGLRRAGRGSARCPSTRSQHERRSASSSPPLRRPGCPATSNCVTTRHTSAGRSWRPCAYARPMPWPPPFSSCATAAVRLRKSQPSWPNPTARRGKRSSPISRPCCRARRQGRGDRMRGVRSRDITPRGRPRTGRVAGAAYPPAARCNAPIAPTRGRSNASPTSCRRARGSTY